MFNANLHFDEVQLEKCFDVLTTCVKGTPEGITRDTKAEPFN